MAPGEGRTQECGDKDGDSYTKTRYTESRNTGPKVPETETKCMQTGAEGTQKDQAPEPQSGSPQHAGSALGAQSQTTGLTNLEIGISSQGFVDQPVTPGVPWAQVHDIALSLLICQRHRWELANRRREQG